MSAPSLPIAATLRRTGSVLVERRVALLQALAFPLALTMVVRVVANATAQPPGTPELQSSFFVWTVTLTLASWIVSAMVAGICHRVVLRGDGALKSRWGLELGRRDLALALRLFVIGFLLHVPTMGLLIARPFTGEVLSVAVIFRLGWVLTAYPASRLSLVLPATAIEQRMTFAQSWVASRGNGWRLTAVLSIPALAVTAVGSTLHDHVDVTLSHASQALSALGFTLLGTFEIVALSCAYRALVEQRREGAAA